jgi:hypothetical protein
VSADLLPDGYLGVSWLVPLIRQMTAELFGQPPRWARSVDAVPAVPAVLCPHRPATDTPVVRVAVGAYGGPLPLDPDVRRFLAGWSDDTGLYFDGEARW